MSDKKTIHISPEKQIILQKLRDGEALYVIMSACTKMPYVLCDPDTYDDEVIVYYEEEDAKREGAKFLKDKTPIQIARIEKAQRLGFFASLYAIGVNSILIDRYLESETRVQLHELVQRPSLDELPEGKIWVENPQLHLTALYFMQELRKEARTELTEELKELQEEILVNFQKGQFIAAVQEKGVPLLKQKDGDAYQPMFTDILEFHKFNKNNEFKPIAIEAKHLLKILASDAKGVVINPSSVNLQFPITRGAAKESAKSVEQIVAEAMAHKEE